VFLTKGESVYMQYILWVIIILVSGISIPAQGVEVLPLADCSIKVFKEINTTHKWSGKSPDGCFAHVYVEKRDNSIFITTWRNSSTENGWTMTSLSTAMGYYEVADRKELKKAARDISSRAARIERCLNSIILKNDPLECRDYGTKTFSAGEDLGTEYKRKIWLDDDKRHSIIEYDYGNTRKASNPEPADLFGGPAFPPGMNIDIHVIDTN
jgi:hypothetical protein